MPSTPNKEHSSSAFFCSVTPPVGCFGQLNDFSKLSPERGTENWLRSLHVHMHSTNIILKECQVWSPNFQTTKLINPKSMNLVPTTSQKLPKRQPSKPIKSEPAEPAGGRPPLVMKMKGMDLCCSFCKASAAPGTARWPCFTTPSMSKTTAIRELKEPSRGMELCSHLLPVSKNKAMQLSISP